jgi:hypothetical protein
MLKASSLFYAIIIALIIAIVSSSLILTHFLRSMEFEGFLRKEKVLRNANSALNLLLSRQEMVKKDSEVIIDLFAKGEDSVMLKRRSWGVYEIILAEAFIRDEHQKKVALIGTTSITNDNLALYLADQDRPLSLCGKTFIHGTCYLPKAGVKRAYIEGQNFIGQQLINGETLKSEKTLPAIKKEIPENIAGMFSNMPENNDSIVAFDYVATIDSLCNSFENKTIILYSTNDIVLKGKTYSGNLNIRSDRTVIVNQDCKLNDVIIYAHEIIIKSGFSGNLQAFANDSIVIEKKCRLEYPSALGIVRTKASPDKLNILLDENSTIDGVILAYQESGNSKQQVKVDIGKEAVITGQVYSNGLADIKGNVSGTLWCNKFILSTASSVYENHLLNARIDRSSLSKYFAGIDLIGINGNKRIISWLL